MPRFVKMPAFRMLGRRGLLLLLFGLLWICYGVAIVAVDLPPRFSDVHFPVLSMLDGFWAGLLWMLAGISAVVTAFARKSFKGKDSLGFNSLLIPPVVWVLGYSWSIVLWLCTEQYGKPSGWVALVVWLIVCAFVMLVADWPDPDDPVFDTQPNRIEDYR